MGDRLGHSPDVADAHAEHDLGLIGCSGHRVCCSDLSRPRRITVRTADTTEQSEPVTPCPLTRGTRESIRTLKGRTEAIPCSSQTPRTANSLNHVLIPSFTNEKVARRGEWQTRPSSIIVLGGDQTVPVRKGKCWVNNQRSTTGFELQSVQFSVRFIQGYRYLDRCGECL